MRNPRHFNPERLTWGEYVVYYEDFPLPFIVDRSGASTQLISVWAGAGTARLTGRTVVSLACARSAFGGQDPLNVACRVLGTSHLNVAVRNMRVHYEIPEQILEFLADHV